MTNELEKIFELSSDSRGYNVYRMGLKEFCEIIGYEPPNVILSALRRVMPQIIANDIIGVQPMTGPAGQIHTLKTRYGIDEDDE